MNGSPAGIEPTIFGSDGAEHRTVSLKIVDTTSEGSITSTFSQVSTDRFWRYVRGSNHDLYLPDGTHCRYEGEAPFTGWEVGFKRLSRCYSPANPGEAEIAIVWEGSRATITQTVFGQKRDVVVELTNLVLGLPTSLEFMGKTWVYTWGGNPTRVTPPTGPGWEYRFDATQVPRTFRIKTPQGGEIGYDIETKRMTGLETSQTQINSDVVTRRWTLDRDATQPHEWTYEYLQRTEQRRCVHADRGKDHLPERAGDRIGRAAEGQCQ